LDSTISDQIYRKGSIMSSITETGLVKIEAHKLAGEVKREREVWKEAREKEGTRLVKRHIELSAAPRWFGLVYPTPMTEEEAIAHVKEQYLDDYSNSWLGWSIREHLLFLDRLQQMTDIALGPAGDGFVYLSGEQISKLKSRPFTYEQEED
jgi:hypothetical protein